MDHDPRNRSFLKGEPVKQGHCVVGWLLVTAVIKPCERRLACRVARAMFVVPVVRW